MKEGRQRIMCFVQLCTFSKTVQTELKSISARANSEYFLKLDFENANIWEILNDAFTMNVLHSLCLNKTEKIYLDLISPV